MLRRALMPARTGQSSASSLVSRRAAARATTAHVRLDVGGTIVTASITNEAVDDLELKPGGKAYAIVKSSDVMIGVD